MLPADYRCEPIAHDSPCRSLREKAEAIATASGIRIVRGRELRAVVFHGSKPVAALWTEYFANCFQFDFAVLSDHRRQGIGTHLAKLGLSDARQMEEEVGATLDLAVVSPESERVLTRLGLVKTGAFLGGITMTFAHTAAAAA